MEPPFHTDPMPVGQMGTIKYVLTSTPATTASYIQLDFSVSDRGHLGAGVSGSLVWVVGAASARTGGWTRAVEGGRPLKPWRSMP